MNIEDRKVKLVKLNYKLEGLRLALIELKETIRRTETEIWNLQSEQRLEEWDKILFGSHDI